MRNPWLDIPAADYLGHMNSPEVAQLGVLSGLLGEALDRFRPADVLLLGCSTGNGLDHIDPAVTRRVCGVDVNPEYLARAAARYPNPGYVLSLECADVMEMAFEPEAFGLVHCALLFEYLDWPRLLPALGDTLRVGGGLSVVLQLPSPVTPAVTLTEFPSLRRLEPAFHFVEPDALVEFAHAAGLALDLRRTEPLSSGKRFEVLHYKKVARRRSSVFGHGSIAGA